MVPECKRIIAPLNNQKTFKYTDQANIVQPFEPETVHFNNKDANRTTRTIDGLHHSKNQMQINSGEYEYLSHSQEKNKTKTYSGDWREGTSIENQKHNKFATLNIVPKVPIRISGDQHTEFSTHAARVL